MSEILSLFSVFSPHLSTATLRQFCEVVFAVLAMTGRVSMRNISRWTSEGGSYRTIQNVAAKLKTVFGSEQTEFGILDLKARYRGRKYLHETLKILPQKPEAIVIDEIAEHLGTIGAIHYTPPQLNPG